MAIDMYRFARLRYAAGVQNANDISQLVILILKCNIELVQTCHVHNILTFLSQDQVNISCFQLA